MTGLDFSAPKRRPARESVVPMINVVFLLLIFFLMTAQIAPPDPVEIAPPVTQLSDAPLPDQARVAWLDRDGTLYFDGLQGDDALMALALEDTPVTLRADGTLAADRFAALLQKMAEAGITQITLATIAGGAP